MMGARPQSPLTDPKLVSHLPVMLDLCVPLVKVIVENELLFIPRQQFQTLDQALLRIASRTLRCRPLRQHIRGDFFTTSILEHDVSSHAVKVPHRITNVVPLKLWQSFDHAIDGLVRIVFGIAETLRDEDAYQAGAN